MSDDDLVKMLAAVAREEEARAEGDARWIARARGDAELEAATDDDRDDAYAAHMRGALRTPTREDDLRLVAAASAAWGAAPKTSPASPGASVHPLAARARSRRAWALGAVSASAAAAAAIFALRSPTAVEELPTYAFVVEGADDAARGQGVVDAVPTLSPDARVRLIARPDRAVDGPRARASAECEGRAIPLAGPIMVSPSGAVRVEGVVAEILPGARGSCAVTFVIEPRGGGATRVVRKAFVVRGASTP